MKNIRLDNLPMSRQAAGYDRKDAGGGGSIFGGSSLDAIFEKRDVDPESPLFKRRHGSVRKTSITPNVLGVLADIDKGRVGVDFNFSTVTNWTVFATLRTPVAYSNGFAPLFQLKGVHAYIQYVAATDVVNLKVYDGSGTLKFTTELGDASSATDYRIMVRYTHATTTVSGVAWAVPALGGSIAIDAESNGSITASGGKLELIGKPLASLTGTYDKVTITNFLLYDVSDFDKDDEYENFAADLTPALTGTNTGGPTAFKLRWHQTFTAGNDVHEFTDTDDNEIFSYLVPTVPSDANQSSPLWLHFGGQGVIEVPFYLDFDEYYWTPVAASSRLEWIFQLEFKMPSILAEGTLFEFQDILRLDIIDDSGVYRLKAIYADDAVVTTAGASLEAGGEYEVFAGRNATQTIIKLDDRATVTGTPKNPAIFNYDKTLGFIIGDTVDQENSQPFGGQIKRIALHNTDDTFWQTFKEAVFYYDIRSLSGDYILDRGNRALNSYVGIRLATSAPYYAEGGFKGGSYVAATGGYVMSVSTPSITYTGELRRSITKDATVQRRGNKAFLNSNSVNYVIDDFSKTFRPMGIPRPATKVSCTPTGVGPIDGFVRYAYRWITKDGTVGPAFELDPLDATGGVNVFLGAEAFGLPGETPFGMSYGECEGYDEDGRGRTADDEVETFIAKDSDGGSEHNILAADIKNPGLTLELATRVPNVEQVKESIFSQGVCAPVDDDTNFTFMADHKPFHYPFWVQKNKENCMMIAFKYHNKGASHDYQALFGIGFRKQYFRRSKTIGHTSAHYAQALVVTIQPAETSTNVRSLVVCREGNRRAKRNRDSDLHAVSMDYNFQDGHDYCVIIRRAGKNFGKSAGTVLAISVFDHTLHDPDAGENGWLQSTFKVTNNPVWALEKFWTDSYHSRTPNEVMWGAGKHQGKDTRVKTLKRKNLGSKEYKFDDGYIRALVGGTTGGGSAALVPGTVLYHGRIWSRDFPWTALAQRCLDRYGGRTSPLNDKLEVDLAFCPDSSVETINGGFDVGGYKPRDLRVHFHSNEGETPLDCHTVLTSNIDQTPILAYGWDMSYTPGTPDVWKTTGLNSVPLWVNWTSRNEGSISVGVGRKVLVEVGTKKWHAGSKVQLFTEFANAIDLTQWTWLTIYYHHIKRITTDTIDVWLERVFIDGNTGEWAEDFDTDSSANSGRGLVTNASATSPHSHLAHQYGLFSVGGMPGMDQKYQTETAEVRLWDGEYYIAKGGGGGDNAFGPYMSSRLPPNSWEDLWYYLRFMKIDVDDVDTQTTMDHKGMMSKATLGSGAVQDATDSVKIYQEAQVKDASDEPGKKYFIPFPTPPLSAIRGIEIFRTQVVPVVKKFPNGKPNPNAIIDAWKATRAAPLYYVSEIPRGTTFYFDSTNDSALGTKLDPQTGLMPRNPQGLFEWEGYLGVYVPDEPRIHFAESPDSWESFPTNMVFNLPIREYGPIVAATEIASRDARQSRVLCLGKSWGVYLDGNPTTPQANTLGGGVGAASARCLVVEKGIAYAYNGTLWAITGDGQIEDIGLPVLDLLPDPSSTRLSVSSSLSSLFVINEDTGVTLRYHLSRRQWFVEDRYALSMTDIDSVDTWVHVSGYPSEGDTTVFQDDVKTSQSEVGLAVASITRAGTAFTLTSSGADLEIGQRITLVGDGAVAIADRDPRARQTVTVAAFSGTTVTVEETLSAADLPTSFTDLSGEVRTLVYNAYIGVGYWGTMVDTGQFGLKGELNHVDVGVEAGDGWWAAFDTSDFARSPTDRSGFASAESQPTNVIDAIGGSGGSARWGLSNQQRFERILVWSPKPTNGSGAGVGLTELELNYTEDPGRS